MSQDKGERRKNFGSTDFLLRIQFRQHATWQGEIQWLGNWPEKKRFFRSFLEMVMLIQEALDQDGRVVADIRCQSWDDCP